MFHVRDVVLPELHVHHQVVESDLVQVLLDELVHRGDHVVDLHQFFSVHHAEYFYELNVFKLSQNRAVFLQCALEPVLKFFKLFKHQFLTVNLNNFIFFLVFTCL